MKRTFSKKIVGLKKSKIKTRNSTNMKGIKKPKLSKIKTRNSTNMKGIKKQKLSKIKTRNSTNMKYKKTPKLSKIKTSGKKKLTKRGGAGAGSISANLKDIDRNNFFFIQSDNTPNSWIEPSALETEALCDLIAYLNVSTKNTQLKELATKGKTETKNGENVKVFCYGVDYSSSGISDIDSITEKLCPISPIIIKSNNKYKYVILCYHHTQGQDKAEDLEFKSIIDPKHNKAKTSVPGININVSNVKNNMKFIGGAAAKGAQGLQRPGRAADRPMERNPSFTRALAAAPGAAARAPRPPIAPRQGAGPGALAAGPGEAAARAPRPPIAPRQGAGPGALAAGPGGAGEQLYENVSGAQAVGAPVAVADPQGAEGAGGERGDSDLYDAIELGGQGQGGQEIEDDEEGGDYPPLDPEGADAADLVAQPRPQVQPEGQGGDAAADAAGAALGGDDYLEVAGAVPVAGVAGGQDGEEDDDE
jgi:hypothetical protein